MTPRAIRRERRAVLALGIATLALAGSGRAQAQQGRESQDARPGFAYAPMKARYRMIVKGAGASQSAAGRNELSFDAEERLTLSLAARTKDTLSLSVTVDSIFGHLQSGDPIDPAVAAALRVNALLSPAGRVYSRQLPDLRGNEAFRTAAEDLARLLPVIPSRLHAGLTWSDTTHEPVNQMGVPITRTRVATYHVLGDTAYLGERAWRVAQDVRISLLGTGTTMGTPITFEGSSTGTGTLYVSHDGRYLGADLLDEATTKASLAALGQEITGTQRQTTKISLMK